jgi:hypothetical protein
MASRVTVEVSDDLDGGTEDVGTVEFGLDGARYEIDLSAANAAVLRDALAPYIAAARRAGPRRAPAHPPVSVEERARNKRIRTWLVRNGYALKTRGRIPSGLVDAWRTGTPAAENDAVPSRFRRTRRP